jgi:hypothetical protein
LRHSQSWSGPARASLAGWPHVGQSGGLSLICSLYRDQPTQGPETEVAPHPSGRSGVMAT